MMQKISKFVQYFNFQPIIEYGLCYEPSITDISVTKVTLQSLMFVRLSVCLKSKPLSLSEWSLSALMPIS